MLLIREIDGRAVAGVSVESCRDVVLRSPWGRLGSLLDVRKRLHRMRCRFQHISANSLNTAAHKTMNYLAMASRALGGPQGSAHAAQATTHYQTYPEGPPGADLHPKKVNNLGPMAPSFIFPRFSLCTPRRASRPDQDRTREGFMRFVSRAAALEPETVKQSLELKLCLWGDQGFGLNRRGDE